LHKFVLLPCSAGLTIVADVAIATGLALLGPRGPLCEICSFLICKGGYFEFRCSRQTLRKRALYFTHDIYRNVIRWKKVKFFNLSGNLLLR